MEEIIWQWDDVQTFWRIEWTFQSNTAEFETTGLGPPGWRPSWKRNLVALLISSKAKTESSRLRSMATSSIQNDGLEDSPTTEKSSDSSTAILTVPGETKLTKLAVARSERNLRVRAWPVASQFKELTSLLTLFHLAPLLSSSSVGGRRR